MSILPRFLSSPVSFRAGEGKEGDEETGSWKASLALREELKTLTLRLVLQQIVGLSVKLWEGEGLVREAETAFLTDRL